MTLHRLKTLTRQLHHLYHTWQLRSWSALAPASAKVHLQALSLHLSSNHHLRVRPTQPQTPTTSTSTSLSTQKRLLSCSPANMATPTKSPRFRRPETYQEALRRLSLLQSNKTIVNLFGSNSSAPENDKTKDLNALAMPEMLAWLDRAGYTPASLTASGLRVVHVAGTKGKGSVSTLISSILTEYTTAGMQKLALGDKVGLYTSPHVLSVRERIQLNGEPISRELFTKYFFELWDRLSEAARVRGDFLPSSGSIQSPASSSSVDHHQPASEEGEEEDEYDGPATKPFYFRFLTLLAFHIFVREGVKSAVVECGIGGEYDPTNCLDPACVTASVITQLGIDHVLMLGDTLPKIAWHKGGILKDGVKGFTRRLGSPGQGVDEQVMQVLRQRAVEKEAASLEEVADSEVDKFRESEVGREIAIEAKLQGPFQKYNMALAAKAAREHLLRLGVQLDGEDGEFARTGRLKDVAVPEFVSGLKKAALRGRCEVFVDQEESHRTEWFVDGAHTEDSLRGVGEWFAGKVEQQDSQDDDGLRILLFNQQDRDPGVLVRALLAGVGGGGKEKPTPVFTHAIFTRNEESPPGDGEPPRDLSVQETALHVFKEGVGKEANVETETKDSVAASIGLVRELAVKEGKPCKVLVTGSFHLVGAVLKTVDCVED